MSFAVLQHLLVQQLFRIQFSFHLVSLSISMACPVLIADVRVLAGEGPPVLTSPTIQLGMWTAAFSAMASFLLRFRVGRDRSIIIGSVAARGSGDGHHPPGRSPEWRSPAVAGSVPSGLSLCGSYWQAPRTSASFGILESSDRVFDCAIFWGQRDHPPVPAIGNNEPFRAYQHYGLFICGPTLYCISGIRWAGHQWHPNAERYASWVCRVHFRFGGFR